MDAPEPARAASSPTPANPPPPLPPPPRRSSASASSSSREPRRPPRGPVLDAHTSARITADAHEPFLPGLPPSSSASTSPQYYITSAVRSSSPDRSSPPRMAHSPPQSPVSPRSHAQLASQPAPPPRPADVRSSNDPRRLRTRTLETLPRPLAPKTGRHRVGSLNRNFELPMGDPRSLRDPMDPPSPQPQPQRPPWTASSSRAASPQPQPASKPSSSDGPAHMSGSDPRTMLVLMYKTRGRMRGKVAYRHMYRTAWSVALCSIDPDEGCLLCESEPGSDKHMVLVHDLRGCSVAASLDPIAGHPIISVTTDEDTMAVQLKPLNESFYNAWFAALLCWSPVTSGAALDFATTQAPSPLSWSLSEGGVHLQGASKDKPRVIKTGQALLVEHDEILPKSRQSLKSALTRPSRQVTAHSKIVPVSCVLSEDGELKLASDSDSSVSVRVSLPQLCRSAVQRLHPSVWNVDRCIGIYPQYSQAIDACSRIRPIFLSFEERRVYEAWFVLLRSFTVPELYGPENANQDELDTEAIQHVLPGLPQSTGPDLVRLESCMTVKVVEVKLRMTRASASTHTTPGSSSTALNARRPAGYTVEILVDGQRKAKTSTKKTASDPHWYESFTFRDLATATSSLTLRVKRSEDGLGVLPEHGTESHASHESWRDLHSDTKPTESIVGEAFISITALERGKDVERWWPLRDEAGEHAGEVLFRYKYDEDAVLMDREYDQLYQMLHHFANALTIRIGEKIPTELTALTTYLLNIFQTTEEAENWLKVLCEEEVDGILKETPSKVSSRFTKRLESNEGQPVEGKDILKEVLAEAGDRHSLLRDLNRSATAEANLLFRGNTLASKAMDAHMRRLGIEYLESTIAPKLRDIATKDIDCEVNPARVSDKRTVQKNWEKLLQLTEDMWSSIHGSQDRCPPELRVIFRHIRACANDRYGYFMRTVSYSSVSGFLFLRFFCAAILSPQSFGLLRFEPPPRAIRSFTLIAKGLQGLANMTLFGQKEPWMEHMNKFVNAHKQEFKDYIDSICDVPANLPLHEPSPSYSTPVQIFRRLPAPSKEGFLSLPYHIDRAYNSAGLIKLWLNNVQNTGANSLSGDVARFHDLCLRLQQRTDSCYERLERSERRISSLSQRWVSIAERMEVAPTEFWIRQRASTPNHALNGIPPPMMTTRSTRDLSRPLAFRSSSDWSIRRRALAQTPPPGYEPEQSDDDDRGYSGPQTPNAEESWSGSDSEDGTASGPKIKKGLRFFPRKKKDDKGVKSKKDDDKDKDKAPKAKKEECKLKKKEKGGS